MRIRTIFGLWLPLAVSFELMMLEGPAVQGAIGLLSNPALNLAAWGLTMALSLLIESPIIMLLSTAIALVHDAQSFRALRGFMVLLSVLCTIVTGAIAFTPLFDFVAGKLMGQPLNIVTAARPALQIMLFWTAAIAWRRFYQGVLVRHGGTRLVSWGTAIRLVAAVGTALVLARQGNMAGVQVAAWAIMAAVVTEAIVTTIFAAPTLSREVFPKARADEPLTQRAIWKFHTPLALTTFLTLLAQPLTSSALARLDAREATLAAWPVAFMVLLVIRGWGLALQEISVAQARFPEAQPALKRFTVMVGVVTSGVTGLIVVTPLLEIYLTRILSLPSALHAYVQVGVVYSLFIPLLTALGSWARGLLVAGGATQAVYVGMGFNLLTHSILLLLGVALHLPGMLVAALSFTFASLVEYLYLLRCVRLLQMVAPVPSPVLTEAVSVAE